MTRSIESGVTAEIAKNAVQPVVFVELDFDSAPLYLWSGIGPMIWDSKTWLGVGDQGKISPITETEEIRAEVVELTFNGIDSTMIATTLTENYQGRTASIWLGFLLNDPVKIFQGYMDVMSIYEGGDTSTVSVTCESKVADLLKAREWRYTHEDQQIDYPGDLGLEFVNDLQDKELVWAPS